MSTVAYHRELSMSTVAHPRELITSPVASLKVEHVDSVATWIVDVLVLRRINKKLHDCLFRLCRAYRDFKDYETLVES
jgi:hypothetical protein